MSEISNDNLSSAEKIFQKIQQASDYESGYHAQSMESYNIYSNLFALLKQQYKGTDIDSLIEKFMNNSRRSNVYYANVETLKGLILPQIPSLVLSLNPAKKTDSNKETKNFYNVCTNILSVIVKNAVDDMAAGVWDAFKLDYIVTGRGVLWANIYEDKDSNQKISLDNVRWQDFVMDTKPTWKSVSWVARRLLFTKRQFKETFDVSEEKISGTVSLDSVYDNVALFDTFGDNSNYIEVWEYFDKPTLTQYYVSKQYNVDSDSDSSRYIVKKKKFDGADPEYFLPTPEPPLLMYNGINLLPSSDVWVYINELTELSQISKKRSKLIESLHLRGYTDTARANIINSMSSATKNGLGLDEDDNIIACAGFTPSPQDPLIYYVDNEPRLQLLQFLQTEYQFLVERIYSLTGISEQMRNVTSNEDDETATSIRLKSKFGSRRLKEHQQKLLNYWVGILKILLHRICCAYNIKDLKNIFSYDFRDSVKKDIQEIVFERADLHRQLQTIQQQLQQAQQQQQQSVAAPEPSQMGQTPSDFPQPNQDGGMPPPPPMQAQPEQNLQQQQGIAGAQLADATVNQQAPAVDQNPQQQQPNATAAMGMIAPPPQQTGVQEDNIDTQVNDAAIQNQQPAMPQGASPSSQDMQPNADDLEAQNQQLLQREQQLSQQYQELVDEVTWDKIIKFFREDKLISFLVSAHLDDLENKIISDEKKNSDLEYMNTIVNLVNQIIANINNNPKFADIYCSIFSLSLDNFDQTKSQRDAIDEFIKTIKEEAQSLITNPPPPPPPTPDDQKKMAEAGEVQMKTQYIQARIQELMMKIQMMSQPESPQPDSAGQNLQSKMSELQLKHQYDMELQQSKILAEQQRYKDQMEADKQLLEMKIQADKERYSEKIKSDYLDDNINDDLGSGINPTAKIGGDIDDEFRNL
jgi:hypothetical protein